MCADVGKVCCNYGWESCLYTADVVILGTWHQQSSSKIAAPSEGCTKDEQHSVIHFLGSEDLKPIPSQNKNTIWNMCLLLQCVWVAQKVQKWDVYVGDAFLFILSTVYSLLGVIEYGWEWTYTCISVCLVSDQSHDWACA